MIYKTSKFLIALSFLFFFFSASNAQSPQSKNFSHEVKIGETLYSIARTYGVSTESILSINPGVTEHIMAGQKLLIPASDSGSTFHTIKKGETLYYITHKYNITAQSLCDANPGLSAENFRAGEVIIIPKASDPNEINIAAPRKKTGCKLTYEVKKKETLYSIARKFNVSEEAIVAMNPSIKKGKVKRKQILCIPYSENETEPEPLIKDVMEQLEPATQNYSTVKVAVILPFGLSTTDKSPESIKMIDFYEGMLLAIDSLKGTGISTDIYTYDESQTANSSINELLSQPMVKHSNIIVGPMDERHIETVARFAEENNIYHIVPFSSKESVTDNMHNVFQINAPNEYIYNKVYSHFINANKESNVIFVESEEDENRKDYVSDFQKILSARSVTWQRINFADIETIETILSKERKNVIIPTNSNQTTFENLVAKLNANDTLSAYPITLFGYPEWQAFSQRNSKNLAKYKCTFFTTFYADNTSGRAYSFNMKFSRWFKREQYNSYPKYGLFGFDIAHYFIKGVNVFGNKLAQNTDNVSYQQIQTPLSFERKNNWSGFVNNSLMFISYNPDETIKINYLK